MRAPAGHAILARGLRGRDVLDFWLERNLLSLDARASAADKLVAHLLHKLDLDVAY